MKLGDTVEEAGGSAVVDNVLSVWTGKTTVESRPLAISLTRALFIMQPREEFAALWRDFVKTVATVSLPFEKYPLSIRTLIVYGLEDEAISEDAMEAVVEKIPSARLAKIPRVGQ